MSLASTADKSFVNKRRELPMYCVLIEHPHEGLILWETVRRTSPCLASALRARRDRGDDLTLTTFLFSGLRR